MDFQKLAHNNKIFEAYSGSISYGTNTALSDEDIRGVFIGTPSNRFGLYPVEQVKSETVDTVHTEIATMFKHFTSGAVNMLEILFINPKHYIYNTIYWQNVLDNRSIFITKQMGHKAIGFVSNMLKRSAHNNSKQDEEWHKQMFKQASHSIRVGRMVSECLLTGEIQVDRTHIDADYLRDIKYGKCDVEEVWQEAEILIQLLKDNLELSVLPHNVNVEAASKLLLETTLDYWDDNRMLFTHALTGRSTVDFENITT